MLTVGSSSRQQEASDFHRRIYMASCSHPGLGTCGVTVRDMFSKTGHFGLYPNPQSRQNDGPAPVEGHYSTYSWDPGTVVSTSMTLQDFRKTTVRSELSDATAA